jgi:cytidine deaminase
MTTNQTQADMIAVLPNDMWDKLFEAAMSARHHAHAPYSHFLVGAALLTADDQIIVGCNMENATYGATVCAERTAFGNAIVQGYREFKALCVVTDLDPPASPCGICRQIFAEFCDDLTIMIANPEKKYYFTTLDELLPYRFGKQDLELFEG